MTDQPHSTGFDLSVVGQILVLPSRTYVTPLHMQPEQVHINDIARALSRICRFNGHVAGYISVAEHSVMVSYLVPEELALEGLLHDASEAYLGDMTRPVKRHPDMASYVEAEERAHLAVATAFGLNYPHHADVSAADNQQLAWEIDNMRDNPRCHMWPDQAERYFLNRYYELERL